jgi:hypothetical protein
VAAGAVSPQKFAADLRELSDGKYWTKELRKSYRRIGTKAAGYSRDEMRKGDRQLARAAGATRGSSTTLTARVSVGGASVPGALAAVWGTKGRTGWFAAPRYRTGRNNPPWIGNNWTVATKGQGPRGINDALADHIDDLRDEVAVEVDRIAAKAFPHRL